MELTGNQWVYDFENTILSLVQSLSYPKLKTKFPQIKFTTEEEHDTPAVFPTVYIHLLPPVEQGQTLDGTCINGMLATVQVYVTTNTDKSDAIEVMSVVSDVFKKMRFQGNELPEFKDSNKMHKSIARFRRIVGASDKLL